LRLTAMILLSPRHSQLRKQLAPLCVRLLNLTGNVAHEAALGVE